MQFLTAKVFLQLMSATNYLDEINSLKHTISVISKMLMSLGVRYFFVHFIRLLKQDNALKQLEILHQFYDEISVAPDSFDYCELLPYERTLELIAQYLNKEVMVKIA